jgi:hypothetical protein
MIECSRRRKRDKIVVKEHDSHGPNVNIFNESARIGNVTLNHLHRSMMNVRLKRRLECRWIRV